MEEKNGLGVKTIKQLVYEHLRDQIRKRELLPGEAINLEKTAKRLGVSRTPLREALIQLEMEGFVSILPHKGVFVNNITKEDIRHFYQIIGALEAAAILSAYPLLKKEHIKSLKEMNKTLKSAVKNRDFHLYNRVNIEFHDLFMELSGNSVLRRIVNTLKKRLYDFPRTLEGIEEWGKQSIGEHEEFVRLLERGKFREAAEYWRDVHWNFDRQERFIVKYYLFEDGYR